MKKIILFLLLIAGLANASDLFSLLYESGSRAIIESSESISPVPHEGDWSVPFERLANNFEHADEETSGFKYRKAWLNNQADSGNIRMLLLSRADDSHNEMPQPSLPLSNPSIDSGKEAGAGIHIFVDYSNITASLNVGAGHPVFPAQLASFLEEKRSCNEKIIAGSFPAPGDLIWKEWNRLGYKTEIASSGKEMFVDDFLHAQILRLILNWQQKAATNRNIKKPTIVIVTGDGNSNNNYTSFVECVKGALENGHRVEIVSWKQRCNKVFIELEPKSKGKLKIKFLDRQKNTFLNLG